MPLDGSAMFESYVQLQAQAAEIVRDACSEREGLLLRIEVGSPFLSYVGVGPNHATIPHRNSNLNFKLCVAGAVDGGVVPRR
jgi:hypothetical protein